MSLTPVQRPATVVVKPTGAGLSARWLPLRLQLADCHLAVALLAAEVRRQVGMLSQAGMSTRAIAPTVGVSNKTIALDQREVLHQVTPAPAHRFYREPEPAERIDYETGEILDADHIAGSSKMVGGFDGKSYRRTDPAPPAKQRRALRRFPRSGSFRIGRAPWVTTLRWVCRLRSPFPLLCVSAGAVQDDRCRDGLSFA